MKPILIIHTGRAPDDIRARHGDFSDWFRTSSRLPRHRVQVVDVPAGEALPAPGSVAGAIITGSAAMVTEKAAWSERAAGWVRDAMDVELPLFGVCYGHQLMAHALGGRVDYLPGGREIGTLSIHLRAEAASDPLASRLAPSFRAHTTHEQSVLEPPRGAQVLASSARDPNHLIRYGASALSAQFHPEFNADIMRAYIRRKRHVMHEEGTPVARVFGEVAPTPVARRLLRLFSAHHQLDHRHR